MRARFLVLIGALTAAMPGRVMAQEVAGNLEGWVTDTAGAPVAGAEVMVRPNPNYLKPTAFQPATAARLGVVLDF